MTSKNITTLKIVFGSFILLGAGIGAGFGIASLTNTSTTLDSSSKEAIYAYDENSKLIDVTDKYIDKNTVSKDYVSRKDYLEESYLLPKDKFKVNQLYVVVKDKVRSETQIENKLVEANLNLLTDVKPNDVVKLVINTIKMDTPSNNDPDVIGGSFFMGDNNEVVFDEFSFVKSDSISEEPLNFVSVPETGESEVYYLKYKTVGGDTFSTLSLRFELDSNNKIVFDVLTSGSDRLVFRKGFVFTPTVGQNKIDVDIVTDSYISKESLITDQLYIVVEDNGVKNLETFKYSDEYVNVNSGGFTIGDVYVVEGSETDDTRKVLIKSNDYLNFKDITTEGLYKKVVGDGVNTISADLSKFYVEKTKLSGTNIYIKDIDDNVKVVDKDVVFVKQPTTVNHITVGSVGVGNTNITFSSEYFYFYEKEDSRKELKNFVLERGTSKALYGVFSTTPDANGDYNMYRFKLKITRSSEATTDSFTIGLSDGVTEYRTRRIQHNTIHTDRVYYDSFPDTTVVQLDSNSNLVINANNFVNLKEHVNSKG